MRKLFLPILLICCFILRGLSQSCLPNGINLLSQADIDNFPGNFPGCTTIGGDVFIYGEDITNLNGLSGLTTIGGDFIISYAPMLTSLSSLQNITSMKSLAIRNTFLTDLTGIQNISSLKNLELWNTALPNLNGFQNLTSLESLYLGYNPSLTDLNGIPNITSLKTLAVYNTGLPNLNGLEHITSILDIQINENPNLTSLNGLQNVTQTDNLSLYGNPLLASLTTLPDITALKNLTIASPVMTSLNGLQNLTSVDNIDLYIWNLTSLAGMENITAIDSLTIIGSLLTSLNGLNNLHSLVGLRLIYNSVLSSLNGLQNLSALGSLDIQGPGFSSFAGIPNIKALDNLSLYNTSVTDLSTVNQLTSLGSLGLSDNPLLTDLGGLENIHALTGSLTISYNALLTSLTALNNVSAIGGELHIGTSPKLANLSGLENVATVGGSVNISYDSLLNNLSPLGNLTSVGGDLNIYICPLLSNLDGLDHIATVGGTIQIFGNSGLTSIQQLTNVNTAFALNISDNSLLTNLNGLEGITKLEGGLVVRNDHALTNFNGLNNLTSVGGNVWIGEHASLQNLSGLENLTEITGPVLSLFDCPLLVNLQGLNNLKKVNGPVYIERNAALANLSGLENLTEVRDIFSLDDNDALVDIQALGHLQSKVYYLWIFRNDLLTSLHGLENITVADDGRLEITGNGSLSNCSIFAVCDVLLNETAATVIIENNAPGCNTPVEAAAMCNSRPVTVFVALANSGPIADLRVSLSGVAQMNLKPTDATGGVHFSFLEDGNFTINLPEVSEEKWQRSESINILSSSTGQDSTVIFITLTPVVQCPELTAVLGLPSFFRSCLVTSDLTASVQNTGTVTADGVKVAVVLPPVLDLMSSVPPAAAQSGDTLYFDMGNIAPFGKANIKLTVRTSCDTFLLGQTLCIETFAAMDNDCPTTLPAFSEIKLSAQCIGDTVVRFTIKNIGDAPTQGWHEYTIIRNESIQYNNAFQLAAQQSLVYDFPADSATWRMEATKFDDGTKTAVALENCGGLTPGLINAFWLDQGPLEYDFACRQVIGSFDPNLKSAVPTGTTFDHTIAANKPVLYTIDFQNTGTDTAFRVLLRDVLPTALDANTFRPVSSSHPCTWEIRENALLVLFAPIALPDSNVNEPASHGFFSFEIDQIPNLPDDTYFNNQAYITFDFNFPILTNIVTHHIGRLTVKTDEPQVNAGLWQVLGNPTRDVAIFQALEQIGGDKNFALYDVSGRQVRLTKFPGQTFEFHRDMLQAGVYFFRISDEKGRVFSGKIEVTE